MTATRVQHARARMAELGLPALLVTRREDIYYLTGFSGSAGMLVVDADRLWLVSDFRYQQQAAHEAPNCEFVLASTSLPATMRDVLSELAPTSIGFDPDHVTVTLFEQFGGTDPEAPYRLQPTIGLIERLRMVKDPEELALIREAVRITDEAYRQVVAQAKPGVTERDLALEAEWYMRQQGAEGLAFDIIIAGGPRSALPHAQPGPRPLAPGDMVIVDMGARYHHYCADMTRTFAIATATPRLREIYAICAQAQGVGVNHLRAGMTGREADALTRDVIAAAGYGEYFGHGTGHGVGLEIHEAPRLSRTAESVIPAGATVTIEPGIYIPEGGVRIEDLVLVTDTGVEILTQAAKPQELPIYG